ncbi:DNA-binding LacI/PurR family transcriptional regulator [Catenuloplanes nepalensis]|uniref:DNA-binding LacI/PurR family transcriptional regulator n=1 Tax=Catenuloplanes nepalensis TaxID=587533 RepID=A0ABT9MS19_9ACTN|nr:substrate-binding domain-containing protein [Catenuloplanes nepalensis]MDP9794232.1 DNA-binding LacI/PurR family transcriptional regulator [Catenuloplanes nepalensis]
MDKPAPRRVTIVDVARHARVSTTAVSKVPRNGPISLTSVDQDGRQMGANAARLLVDRITDRTRRTAQVTLSPGLVVRRTTGGTAP